MRLNTGWLSASIKKEMHSQQPLCSNCAISNLCKTFRPWCTYYTSISKSSRAPIGKVLISSRIAHDSTTLVTQEAAAISRSIVHHLLLAALRQNGTFNTTMTSVHRFRLQRYFFRQLLWCIRSSIRRKHRNSTLSEQCSELVSSFVCPNAILVYFTSSS